MCRGGGWIQALLSVGDISVVEVVEEDKVAKEILGSAVERHASVFWTKLVQAEAQSP